MLIRPSPLNAPFLDPQKTSENREVFHGVEKRCIGYNLEFRKTEMLSFINNSGQTNLMDINDVIIFLILQRYIVLYYLTGLRFRSANPRKLSIKNKI